MQREEETFRNKYRFQGKEVYQCMHKKS
jgi:hypothetical protein